MTDRLFSLEQHLSQLRQQADQCWSVAHALNNNGSDNRLLSLEQSLDLSKQLGYSLSEIESELMNREKKSDNSYEVATQLALLGIVEDPESSLASLIDALLKIDASSSVKGTLIPPFVEKINEEIKKLRPGTQQYPLPLLKGKVTYEKKNKKDYSSLWTRKYSFLWRIEDSDKNTYYLGVSQNRKLYIHSPSTFQLPPSSTQPKLPNFVGSINHRNPQVCAYLLNQSPLNSYFNHYVIKPIIREMSGDEFTTERIPNANVWKLKREGKNPKTYYARLTDQTLELYNDSLQNIDDEEQITIAQPGSQILQNVIYLPWGDNGDDSGDYKDFLEGAQLVQYHLPNMHPKTLTGGNRELKYVDPLAKVYVMIHGSAVSPKVSINGKRYTAKDLANRLKQDGLDSNHRELELLVCYAAQSIAEDTRKKAKELEAQYKLNLIPSKKKEIGEKYGKLPKPSDFETIEPNPAQVDKLIPPFVALLVQELKNLGYTKIRIIAYMGKVRLNTFTANEPSSTRVDDRLPGKGQIWVMRGGEEFPGDQFKQVWL